MQWRSVPVWRENCSPNYEVLPPFRAPMEKGCSAEAGFMREFKGKSKFLGVRSCSWILLLLSLALFSTQRLYAATYFVDGNCPLDGNGTAVSCASTSGGAGPKKSLTSGLALLSAAGDVLNVRGIHPIHDGETATFDGRYGADRFQINGKHGAAGNPMVIQPYGYTGPGTGEATFVEGTLKPSQGW